MDSTGESAKRKVRTVIAAASAAVVIVIIAAAFVVLQAMNSKTASDNDNPAALRQRLLPKIEQYLELPEGEQPTVGRISDKEKVNDQPFFKNAEDGDYLIVYEDEGTAILYREPINKLIKVGTITVKEAQQEPLQPEKP